MHVTMNGDVSLNVAHATTELIEDAILKVVAPADVTVHVEPADEARKAMEGYTNTLTEAANTLKQQVEKQYNDYLKETKKKKRFSILNL